MNDRALAFLETNHAAAMITLRKDGTPHSVRVSLTIVDGELWSSGTQSRLRTKHLRRDPRCTLFVFEAHGGGYLTLECNVRFIEGEAAADANVRLIEALQPESRQTGMFRLVTGKQVTRQAYRDYMVKDQRLIYVFDVKRTYGVA